MRSPAVFALGTLMLFLAAGCTSWVKNPVIDPNYAAQIKAWRNWAEKAANHKIFEIRGTEDHPVKIVGTLAYYGDFRLSPPPVFHAPPSGLKIFMDGLVRLAPYGLGGYGLWAQHATTSDFIKAGYGRPASGPVSSTSNNYTMNANANNNAGPGSVEWNLGSKNPVDNSATAPPLVVGGP